ncbi:MAG: NeuD/PglB/VioB family sugar acetyltransferase [Bacteroidota bacterium]
MKRIAICGAGGLGKEVLCIINALNEVSKSFEFVGYYDDYSNSNDILGTINDVNRISEPMAVVVAVGHPNTRKNIVDRINNHLVEYATLIHPSVIIGDTSKVEIEPGTIIAAGSILTTDINLCAHSFINLNCTIGHDVRIGSFSSLMPGVNIAGNVDIADEVFIGAGSNLINNLNIGNNAVIGAGSTVIGDIQSNVTAVGVPARVIKKNNERT